MKFETSVSKSLEIEETGGGPEKTELNQCCGFLEGENRQEGEEKNHPLSQGESFSIKKHGANPERPSCTKEIQFREIPSLKENGGESEWQQ